MTDKDWVGILGVHCPGDRDFFARGNCYGMEGKVYLPLIWKAGHTHRINFTSLLLADTLKLIVVRYLGDSLTFRTINTFYTHLHAP